MASGEPEVHRSMSIELHPTPSIELRLLTSWIDLMQHRRLRGRIRRKGPCQWCSSIYKKGSLYMTRSDNTEYNHRSAPQSSLLPSPERTTSSAPYFLPIYSIPSSLITWHRILRVIPRICRISDTANAQIQKMVLKSSPKRTGMTTPIELCSHRHAP